jgi:hypothetical protein
LVASACSFSASEKTSLDQELKPELKVLKNVCEELGYKVFATDYHSTENYITQTALNNIVGSGSKALQPYEKMGDNGVSWDKNKTG